MTFQEWWKLLKPAECDEVKSQFEECWQQAYQAGQAELVAGKREVPTGAKLDAFCNFIGSEPVENDGGWSLEVWNAAWEACERGKQ